MAELRQRLYECAFVVMGSLRGVSELPITLYTKVLLGRTKEK